MPRNRGTPAAPSEESQMSHSRPNRRSFLDRTTRGLVGAALVSSRSQAQEKGHRPAQSPGVTVLNPRNRVPVGLIIDDSTCLVNLNRFAMPQFNEAWGGKRKVYHRNWKDWPAEIPDSFVRKFGEWCAEQGVKGKYSIVPFPACVGRLDLEVPGWSRREIKESIKLVQELMMPNWDIHPEMVTHTRVINLKTGHPFPEIGPRTMENWDFTTGKSADEIAAYQVYALQILKNIGLPCEGVTTPGGYGNRARPQLAQACLDSLREVFQVEIPHYFRHLFTDDTSVAPRVELASGLDTKDPKCVVSVIGCTGDWTGGWDNVEPAGADRFITPDLKSGRMVEVITRGEPAMMVCHWTGIHWNGEEKGFNVFKEVVRRLHARFDNLIWMKLSELSRYWAAKELTTIVSRPGTVEFDAPFACPAFTVRLPGPPGRPSLVSGQKHDGPLALAPTISELKPGSFTVDTKGLVACFDLIKGKQSLTLNSGRPKHR